MNPTANQQRAINEPGNLLVMAAAGAGKTGTLVQRCLRLLLRPQNPVSVRRILVVTFTEAAAAEVRERIRHQLEKAAEANPLDENLQEQLANVDSAFICTLHSFCFQLVRRHVLQLELDPAITVLEPHQAQIQFESTLDLLLREHYESAHENSTELQQLIRVHYGGWAKPLRTFIQRMHEFTQTRPNPERWFETTLAELDQPECSRWRTWYEEALWEWCAYWAPYLETLPAANTNAAECTARLRTALATQDQTIPGQIVARNDDKFWPKNKKGEHSKPLLRLFEEASFLDSLQATGTGRNPLDEDWDWMRKPLKTMLRAAQQFKERFRLEKLERGVVDFHDLEQFSLKLLTDPETGAPTELAREWQEKFEAVFVDEYQDINAAQDLILSALSSEMGGGNRFLVGDVKQSIYRFRQADPAIFRHYMQQTGWQTIPLSENFRSHEGVLQFVNPLFRWLMKPAFGGLEYDEAAALKVGNPTERTEMLCQPDESPHVELHLLLTEQEQEREGEEPEIENAEVEARLVAKRLRELKESGFSFYDQKQHQRRAVEWKDMVVLLRAAKNRLETYAKAFAAAGVPLQTKRNAFFTTQEVLDLCNVLHLLDNPLQDIPLVGVLHSPIVGLTATELATIRIHSQATPFWRSLNEVYERKVEQVPRDKIEKFLNQFHAWRNGRRCSSLAQKLELILKDTGYEEWLLSQPRGRERMANVQQLIRIARQFDESRGESLYLFLRHLEELQDSAGDIEPAACIEENAVRLMTVHQSKGLEFPVVAVADLGKQFNFSDQAFGFAVHDRFGLCSTIKPPHTGQRYPSLPLWLTRRCERFESIGEEMRVLYVALTRAQNQLLLFGSSTGNRPGQWDERAQEMRFPQQVLQHRSWLDWLGTFTSRECAGWAALPRQILKTSTVEVHGKECAEPVALNPQIPRIDLTGLKLDFTYPHEGATRQAAKTSVTALRREAEVDEETAAVTLRFKGEKDGRTRGLATHKFLEHLSLSSAMDPSGLHYEAERQVRENILEAEEAAMIDLEAVSVFWRSSIGRELLTRSAQVKRELPFTFKATRWELQEAGLSHVVSVPPDDFVIIQGVADLVLHAPKEIWLVDFKSDQVSGTELRAATERYKPQVILYAAALSAIHKRPVTRKGIFFLHAREFAWYGAVPEKRKDSAQLELF